MDFLEIRRKAKERAAAGEGGQAHPSAAAPAASAAALAEAAPQPAPPPAPGRAGRPPAAREAAPVLTEADVTAGKLAAQLQGLPPARDGREEPPGEPDARFTTWRPGEGARPIVPVPEPGPEPTPAPSDFAVVDPATLRAPRAEPGPVTVTARAPAPATTPAPPTAAPPEPRPEPRAEPSGRRSSARSPDPERDPLDDFFYRPDEELPAASALPAEAPVEAEEVEDAGVEEYLTFLLGHEEYAVAIERVREVLKSQQITEVPRAPAGILGVVTVRGEVVAVFDPRRRLGLPGPTPDPGFGRIVIVDDGEGPCGLLVDLVASVVRLARGSIEPTPQGIGGAAAECLAGIGREKGRLFTVLDLGALLRRGPAAPRAGRAHDGA